MYPYLKYGSVLWKWASLYKKAQKCKEDKVVPTPHSQFPYYIFFWQVSLLRGYIMDEFYITNVWVFPLLSVVSCLVLRNSYMHILFPLNNKYIVYLNWYFPVQQFYRATFLFLLYNLNVKKNTTVVYPQRIVYERRSNPFQSTFITFCYRLHKLERCQNQWKL